jgi:uncharacterized Ntn-hydrolase superfamily protein
MRPSTFSIAAVDVATGEAGVAVASKFLAAGSIVAWARAGAVATQAAFRRWVGVENFEERWRDDDMVDREILSFMRRRYGS